MGNLRNLLLLTVLSVPVSASDTDVPRDGSETCSAWTSSASTSIDRKEPMRIWAGKFVSSHARKKQINTRKMLEWIDDFCRANPAATIHTAAELYTEQHYPDPEHPLLQ